MSQIVADALRVAGGAVARFRLPSSTRKFLTVCQLRSRDPLKRLRSAANRWSSSVGHELINRYGDNADMQHVVNASNSNPAHRRNEMMACVKGWS
ncbi:replication endonuclease [Salmonella enterica subsp. enterica]|nr:replication endonuclease [Salmonella enterica subsp. enterica]